MKQAMGDNNVSEAITAAVGAAKAYDFFKIQIKLNGVYYCNSTKQNMTIGFLLEGKWERNEIFGLLRSSMLYLLSRC